MKCSIVAAKSQARSAYDGGRSPSSSLDRAAEMPPGSHLPSTPRRKATDAKHAPAAIRHPRSPSAENSTAAASATAWTFRRCRECGGEPTSSFPRQKVAVFCDGCYWHGCPQHGTWPRANAAWWREKIAATDVATRIRTYALRAPVGSSFAYGNTRRSPPQPISWRARSPPLSSHLIASRNELSVGLTRSTLAVPTGTTDRRPAPCLGAPSSYRA